jgi:hypothetical protein
VLSILSSSQLNIFYDTLNIIQQNTGDKWRSNLPHFFASAYIESTDKDIRKVFFWFTLKACISTNSPSALQRILETKSSSSLEDATHWAKQISETIRKVTPWVQAKLRPILTVLRSY